MDELTYHDSGEIVSSIFGEFPLNEDLASSLFEDLPLPLDDDFVNLLPSGEKVSYNLEDIVAEASIPLFPLYDSMSFVPPASKEPSSIPIPVTELVTIAKKDRKGRRRSRKKQPRCKCGFKGRGKHKCTRSKFTKDIPGMCYHGCLWKSCDRCTGIKCEHGNYHKACTSCGTGTCDHPYRVPACLKCGHNICKHGLSKYGCRVCKSPCDHKKHRRDCFLCN